MHGEPPVQESRLQQQPPHHDPGPCAALGLVGQWLQPWGEAVPSCIAAVGKQRGEKKLKKEKKKR